MKGTHSFFSMIGWGAVFLLSAVPWSWAGQNTKCAPPNAGEYKDARQFPKPFTETDGTTYLGTVGTTPQVFSDVYPKKYRREQEKKASSAQCKSDPTQAQSGQARAGEGNQAAPS